MSSSRTSTPRSPPASQPDVTYTIANTFIQRSRPYLTSKQIDALLPQDPHEAAKDINIRLNGCQWIIQVSRVLQFPVRTMATAMILYHRFLLFNLQPYFEQNWIDPAAASLFVACKIEDTLKKSREILAASYNTRHPQLEPINPDSPLLDDSVKRVIGTERLVLETSSFDFRNRHAHPFLIKFCRYFNVRTSLARRAWEIALDVYRTLAPLRATPHALALASLDLAARLEEEQLDIRYHEFDAGRETALVIIDDLLELYTNHSSQTIVGPKYNNTTYLNLRIDLNRERKKLVNGHGHNGDSSQRQAPIQLPAVTDRNTNGTIRFMIDPERERIESAMFVPTSTAAAAAAVDGPRGRVLEMHAVNGDSPRGGNTMSSGR